MGDVLVEEHEENRGYPVELHVISQVPCPANTLFVKVEEVVDVERVVPPGRWAVVEKTYSRVISINLHNSTVVVSVTQMVERSVANVRPGGVGESDDDHVGWGESENID